jgi:GTPase
MASIFSFDPDPPRVASPWLKPADISGSSTPETKSKLRAQLGESLSPLRGSSSPFQARTPPPGLLSDYNVTKLEPEPQTGPAEYKLHLLLRPRRTYTSFSTGTHTAAAKQTKPGPCQTTTPVAPTAPTSQSRQNRLQQLTTQLLWRLQQSSPYHASSTSDLVLPQLPEITATLNTPARPGKLLAGLEASRGALYEIGVADDGVFVGLTDDEMEESLTNLRAMASSLGCNVEVTRMVIVGECEWYQTESAPDGLTTEEGLHQQLNGKPLSEAAIDNQMRRAHLWVAEALVTPDLTVLKEIAPKETNQMLRNPASVISEFNRLRVLDTIVSLPSSTEQLRVTLTGPTTCGKSSLLGTLSTATLDNGRGKSRLSLLKHRHELITGVTSSVAQELLGYKASHTPGIAAEVINYATGNVTSWTDIHGSSEDGRLVFMADSAGHPKYRRTTVRGLIGWAPHWMMLCIAGDDSEKGQRGVGGTTSAQDILGSLGAGIDLSKAHLDLCLQLEKPLAIVITKLDIASRTGLRQTLAKILSAVKAAGRTPAILPPDSSKGIVDSDLETIAQTDADAVKKVICMMHAHDLRKVVPIIMTSAAKGTGIRMLHALLCSLPIPPTPTSHDYIGDVLNPEQPACLFHVEETFTLPAAFAMQTSHSAKQLDAGTVVAGYLRFGSLLIGDTVVVGPFPAHTLPHCEDDRLMSTNGNSNKAACIPPGSLGPSVSHLSSSELARIAECNPSAMIPKGEWHNARIVSIRNLRLPVHKLEAGQVGTIGIVFDPPEQDEVIVEPTNRITLQVPRLRKGMVLAVPSIHMKETGISLQSASGFTAVFEDSDINSVTPGSLVVVYIASIRASARIVKLSPHVPVSHISYDVQISEGDTDSEDGFFGHHDDTSKDETDSEPAIFGSDGITDVTLELVTNREWIELGSQVLVIPGGGQGLYYGSERGEKGVAGLEGFAGRIIEVVD